MASSSSALLTTSSSSFPTSLSDNSMSFRQDASNSGGGGGSGNVGGKGGGHNHRAVSVVAGDIIISTSTDSSFESPPPKPTDPSNVYGNSCGSNSAGRKGTPLSPLSPFHLFAGTELSPINARNGGNFGNLEAGATVGSAGGGGGSGGDDTNGCEKVLFFSNNPGGRHEVEEEGDGGHNEMVGGPDVGGDVSLFESEGAVSPLSIYHHGNRAAEGSDRVVEEGIGGGRLMLMEHQRPEAQRLDLSDPAWPLSSLPPVACSMREEDERRSSYEHNHILSGRLVSMQSINPAAQAAASCGVAATAMDEVTTAATGAAVPPTRPSREDPVLSQSRGVASSGHTSSGTGAASVSSKGKYSGSKRKKKGESLPSSTSSSSSASGRDKKKRRCGDNHHHHHNDDVGAISNTRKAEELLHQQQQEQEKQHPTSSFSNSCYSSAAVPLSSPSPALCTPSPTSVAAGATFTPGVVGYGTIINTANDAATAAAAAATANGHVTFASEAEVTPKSYPDGAPVTPNYSRSRPPVRGGGGTYAAARAVSARMKMEVELGGRDHLDAGGRTPRKASCVGVRHSSLPSSPAIDVTDGASPQRYNTGIVDRRGGNSSGGGLSTLAIGSGAAVGVWTPAGDGGFQTASGGSAPALTPPSVIAAATTATVPSGYGYQGMEGMAVYNSKAPAADAFTDVGDGKFDHRHHHPVIAATPTPTGLNHKRDFSPSPLLSPPSSSSTDLFSSMSSSPRVIRRYGKAYLATAVTPAPASASMAAAAAPAPVVANAAIRYGPAEPTPPPAKNKDYNNKKSNNYSDYDIYYPYDSDDDGHIEVLGSGRSLATPRISVFAGAGAVAAAGGGFGTVNLGVSSGEKRGEVRRPMPPGKALTEEMMFGSVLEGGNSGDGDDCGGDRRGGGGGGREGGRDRSAMNHHNFLSTQQQQQQQYQYQYHDKKKTKKLKKQQQKQQQQGATFSVAKGGGPSPPGPAIMTETGPAGSTCTCKKCKCLKLYCDCFATSKFCGPLCLCNNCHNVQDDETLQAARRTAIDRNPEAFIARKLEKTAESLLDGAGCGCTRSQCLKKYCVCFHKSVLCGGSCKCEGCMNTVGSRSSQRSPAGISTPQQPTKLVRTVGGGMGAATEGLSTPSWRPSSGGKASYKNEEHFQERNQQQQAQQQQRQQQQQQQRHQEHMTGVVTDEQEGQGQGDDGHDDFDGADGNNHHDGDDDDDDHDDQTPLGPRPYPHLIPAYTMMPLSALMLSPFRAHSPPAATAATATADDQSLTPRFSSAILPPSPSFFPAEGAGEGWGEGEQGPPAATTATPAATTAAITGHHYHFAAALSPSSENSPVGGMVPPPPPLSDLESISIGSGGDGGSYSSASSGGGGNEKLVTATATIRPTARKRSKPASDDFDSDGGSGSGKKRGKFSSTKEFFVFREAFYFPERREEVLLSPEDADDDQPNAAFFGSSSAGVGKRIALLSLSFLDNNDIYNACLVDSSWSDLTMDSALWLK